MTSLATASEPASKPEAARAAPPLPTLVSWMVSLPIAFLLLASAVAHLSNPYQFLGAVREYQLLPRAGAELVAALLPFLHITLALCLLTGRARGPAFGTGFFLFLLYASAQLITLARGMKVDCGCFGPSEASSSIGARSIAIAATSALLCLVGWWSTPPEPTTLPRATAGPVP